MIKSPRKKCQTLFLNMGLSWPLFGFLFLLFSWYIVSLPLSSQHQAVLPTCRATNKQCCHLEKLPLNNYVSHFRRSKHKLQVPRISKFTVLPSWNYLISKFLKVLVPGAEFLVRLGIRGKNLFKMTKSGADKSQTCFCNTIYQHLMGFINY